MNNLNTAIIKLCDYKNIYRSFKYNKNPKKNIMYMIYLYIYIMSKSLKKCNNFKEEKLKNSKIIKI